MTELLLLFRAGDCDPQQEEALRLALDGHHLSITGTAGSGQIAYDIIANKLSLRHLCVSPVLGEFMLQEKHG